VLEREVQELTRYAQRIGGKAGVAILETPSGRLLVGENQTIALNPASNAKLLTAAAALERLGPDYRYTTGLYGVLRGGVVKDLVLRGHGDPSLEVQHLWELGRELVALGLRRVQGRILVDQSRFDDDYLPPAYQQRPSDWSSYRAPVCPVALARNSVSLHVLPGEEGKPAEVWFEPPGFVEVSGTIGTERAGTGQAIDLKLLPHGAKLRAEVSGHIASGLGLVRSDRRVDDPRAYAGFVLASLLKSLGVELKGEVALGGAGQHDLLVSHRSLPLGMLVRELGKNSDNFYAEMLLKTLGAEAGDGTGSSERGAQVLLSWLKGAGALEPGTVVKNGSGLYDANRASALVVARILTTAVDRPSIAPDFLAQLAVGGIDGTLRSRFRQYRAARTIRAKTGTLAEVDALSGYILGERGRPPLVFAILVNGPLGDHREARRRIDRVVVAAAEAWAGDRATSSSHGLSP
jgi:D-alanyl-D-alanine carboxypeptidase/D-alanyl-D-alanine-endopeptidase (penicillin-binding protein 4)